MASRRKARIYAMQALFSWETARQSLTELLEFEWIDRREERADTLDFTRLLVTGAIECLDEIDAVIQEHLEHWKLERLGRVDLAILRLSTYSLLHQRDIPASITIDEAVEIAREYGTEDSYRFVNGVLDAIRRNLPG